MEYSSSRLSDGWSRSHRQEATCNFARDSMTNQRPVQSQSMANKGSVKQIHRWQMDCFHAHAMLHSILLLKQIQINLSQKHTIRRDVLALLEPSSSMVLCAEKTIMSTTVI